MATAVDLAVLVGLQASGKSTFYAQRLSSRYELVSKDLFPRNARNKQQRQMRLLAEHLAAGRPVALDNTNPSPQAWEPLVELAHALGATVTAYWFPPDVAGSLRRNAARQGRDRVPDVGVLATLKQLREPSPADGFDVVREVRFDGRGGFEVRRPEPPHTAGPGGYVQSMRKPDRKPESDIREAEQERAEAQPFSYPYPERRPNVRAVRHITREQADADSHPRRPRPLPLPEQH
ncbi:AAA family ATPase [Streptomyces sp. NPDC054849]